MYVHAHLHVRVCVHVCVTVRIHVGICFRGRSACNIHGASCSTVFFCKKERMKSWQLNYGVLITHWYYHWMALQKEHICVYIFNFGYLQMHKAMFSLGESFHQERQPLAAWLSSSLHVHTYTFHSVYTTLDTFMADHSWPVLIFRYMTAYLSMLTVPWLDTCYGVLTGQGPSSACSA